MLLTVAMLEELEKCTVYTEGTALWLAVCGAADLSCEYSLVQAHGQALFV